MKSDTLLDYAVFQLSPKRSRCELFVSGDGKTEKLASGLLKPFATHLKVAEEQLAQAAPSIKLEVEKHISSGTWFTKGTLERFVRFVSTPEVLELVNTFDAEMSQLEAARRIYSQGVGDQLSSALGGDEGGVTEAADITKKELLRAIDVRLVAVKQDLTTACARASAAGFTPDTVSELQLFADRFGAPRLNEACNKFISLSQRRPDLIKTWKAGGDDHTVRSSSGSDMSVDDSTEETVRSDGIHQLQHQAQQQQQQTSQERNTTPNLELQFKPSSHQRQSSLSFPVRRSLREPGSERDDGGGESEARIEKETKQESVTESSQTNQPARRLSVQDRINLFENKQKEQSGSGGKVVVGKPGELRRLPSDVSSAPQVVEKAVLRRWSGASDMSIELSNERKDTESAATTPCSSSNSQAQSSMFSIVSEDKGIKGPRDKVTSYKAELRVPPGRVEDSALKDTANSQPQVGGFPTREENVELKDSEARLNVFSESSEDVKIRDKPASRPRFNNTFSEQAENVGWKGQMPSDTHSQSVTGGGEDSDLKDQASSQIRFRSYPARVEQVGMQDQSSSLNLSRTSSIGAGHAGAKDQPTSQAMFGGLTARRDDVHLKDHAASKTKFETSVNTMDDVEVGGQLVGQALSRAGSTSTVDTKLNLKESSVSQVKPKAFLGKFGSSTETTNLAASESQYKIFDGSSLASQSRWRSFPGKIEEVGKKELVSSESKFGGFPTEVEDFSVQGMRLLKQSSLSEQSKRLQEKRSESIPNNTTGEPVIPTRKVMESLEMFSSAATAPVEQVQKVRQSKGNQELNDELQMKANELEKLFAAHKLRVPAEQLGSARRSKVANVQDEQTASDTHGKPTELTPVQLHEKNPVKEPFGSSSKADFDVGSLMKMVDNRGFGSSIKHNVTELGLSEDCKGKFYDRYMQKRDAKLREEWGSKRAQKEAKMKAMQDSLERSRAEMKAKFAGSADRQDSALHAHRRAEMLRSFKIHPAAKSREQPIEPAQSEEDEDLSEYTEQAQYGQDRSFSDVSLGDGSSRSTQPKRLLHNRSLSSSTPRTSATSVPRSSVKGSNSNSGRRRTQPENSLMQSVPNFSDLRKENTKPSSAISKTTNRSQRSYARSRSVTEELVLSKEDKPRRSQSMRRSSVNPGELKDLSPLNSDSVVLTPLRLAKEQTEQGLYSKVPKNGESKPFLRKGNGIGPGAGAGIAKLKASVASDSLKNEDSDEMADQAEGSVDMVNEEEEEEFEAVTGEEIMKAIDFPADSDNEKPRLSQESENPSDPTSDNGEVLQSLSQVPNSAEVATAVPSTLSSSLGHLQDSPEESPASWNSHMHHPFSYTNETSDIDASVDSPMGSPASWNSHSLTQVESDAARMRKKWGSAQKPILVANASHVQSRKDVTKGFKRLLKFGRKNRGTESLVDWISATTSEGDDDTEDGRDLANRSSEDLRKSRMGFTQGHSSYDGFNDGELFNEQVQAIRSSIPAPPANFKLREDHLSGSSLKAPRSFFSLSSFRSKGSESKPR
ncbi:PREDICTED: uncharacterized protein LOC104600482 isoform X2 [Nelumbo nucifera]|uniref:Uncharacterized protein LOC104600482 isoform X2 n=2 Tax=Nelumbo nucifera TaxID=4432 RepID=A0A1U8A5L6_NELNU|nr:PREDICTED: uncharacterized protein LOC104600482 isoform X2 [Nelumbo nucifera]DAD44181.1 TPA_asm: hypothetical protein HUJ06_002411 [Nelumbo nucifera]